MVKELETMIKTEVGADEQQAALWMQLMQLSMANGAGAGDASIKRPKRVAEKSEAQVAAGKMNEAIKLLQKFKPEAHAWLDASEGSTFAMEMRCQLNAVLGKMATLDKLFQQVQKLAKDSLINDYT